MEYKYIKITEIKTNKKTKTFMVISKSDNFPLAEIKWYSRWRQYCFFPEKSTIWNKGCLDDINNFLTQIMEERKLVGRHR